MDRTALRVERIRQDLEGKQFAIDLLARIHIAMLAVSVTMTASAGIAGITRQFDSLPVAAIALVAGAAVASQVRALHELTRQWTIARAKASQATDSLIAFSGEETHDGEEDATA